MKRTEKFKNVNRRSIFNHLNRNVVYPSLYLGPVDLSKQTSVEIKELRSDEDSDNEQPDNCNYSHVWCYNDEEQENNYKINKEARERRRAQCGNNEIYNELFDQMCTEFYGIDCHSSFDGITGNQDKCYTVINDNLSYDTSSDEEYMEVQNDDILNGNGFKNEEYYRDNVVAYSNGFTEKRTIWIFSEKNKRALSEHDYELINIPDKDSSSTVTEEEEPTRDTNMGNLRRLATPIPTYIPKLFLPLSPTLPTVTEVVETGNKSSSNVSEVHKTATPQMPRNNWVQDQETVQNSTEQENKSSNGIHKSTLTPREKRRLRNSMNKEALVNKVAQEPKVIVNKNSSDFANTDVIEKEINVTHLNELDSQDAIENDSYIKHSSDDVINLRKPQIKLNHQKKPNPDIITEPLEKLDGKWIGDEEITLDVYEYDLDQKDCVQNVDVQLDKKSDGNKFSVTNVSLMKPTAWTQYLPITGSVPSLQLSFQTNYEEDKKSCFKRFYKFICCKKV